MDIAQIALSTATFAIDRPYSYQVPPELDGRLEPGMRVLVPFGAGNQPCEGLVLSCKEDTPTGKLKKIRSLLDEAPVLSREALQLALWMRERYFCTVYAAAQTMLPTGLWYVLKKGYALTEGMDRETAYAQVEGSPKARRLLELLFANGGSLDLDQVKDLPDLKDPQGTFRILEREGIVHKQVRARRKVGDKTEKMARLVMEADQAMDLIAPKRKTAPMQYAVTELLCHLGRASVKELCYFTGASQQTMKALAKIGVLVLEEQEVFRRELPAAGETHPLSQLNAQQETAFQGLRGLLEERKPSAALLYGVTGSGKTQVYLHLIQATLDQGRGAIVMVPEIALTPSLLKTFLAHFGRQVAVLHSCLPTGERYDEWKRVRDGLARVVIGTRSAVFAPLPDPGLIILDEEQEGSYQSESMCTTMPGRWPNSAAPSTGACCCLARPPRGWTAATRRRPGSIISLP